MSLFSLPIKKKSPIKLPLELQTEQGLIDYLGISKKEKNKICWYRDRMYHSFSVSKKSSKIRTITAPDERLKFLQRKIATLLEKVYSPRNPVHGFVTGRSVKTNASSHFGRKYLLNIDLSDFFTSISENRVKGLLISLGMDKDVSFIISRFCCYANRLPQGAPSSPVLSNMICFSLDRELLSIAKNSRSIYTRYADDITFSSYQLPTGLFQSTPPPAGNFPPEMLNPKLLFAISKNGFTVNPDKTYFADRNARRIVTGLKINELINVDRKFIRNLRSAIHAVEKKGIREAQAQFKDKYNGKSHIREYIFGKIGWIKHIKGPSDPMVRGIMMRYNQCFPGKSFKIDPTAEEIENRSVWVVEHDGDAGTQGTAFFLNGVGLVTAAHCVKDVEDVRIYHPSKPSNTFIAKVKDKCDHRDLAILEHSLNENEYFELEIADNEINLESSTRALGYPGFGPGDKINIRTGSVSSLPTKSSVKLVEVTQKIAQGMSGGPLLNEDGRVIGINHKGGPEMARDFAVHIDELRKWLSI